MAEERLPELAAAAAKLREANAAQGLATDADRVSLVQTYFGQVLAAQVLATRRDTLAGMERHLRDAQLPPHYTPRSLLAFIATKVEFADRAPIVSRDSLAQRIMTREQEQH